MGGRGWVVYRDGRSTPGWVIPGWVIPGWVITGMGDLDGCSPLRSEQAAKRGIFASSLEAGTLGMLTQTHPSRRVLREERMDELNKIDGLNLNHLFYFHAVATRGSIVAAARALGLGQSTISQQIRELEATLGEPLFSRGSRELAVNGAGQRVLEQTSVMIGAAERLVEYFRPEHARMPIALRVGYSASLARAQIANDLLPLLELEDARLRVRSSDATDLLQALLRAELDLVISDQPPPDSIPAGITTEALPGSPLVAVVAAGHPACEVDKEQWRSLPLVQYTVSSRFRWDVEQWLRSSNLRPSVLAEADDVGLLLAAARAGRCFAVVPQAALVDAGAGFRIVARLENAVCERYAIYQGGEPLEVVRRAVTLLVSRNTM